MSNHTTTQSARTLNYALNPDTLNRIRAANLQTAKVDSMKASGEGFFGKDFIPDVLKATKLVATTAVDYKKALDEGKEATRVLKQKFKNAELTEGWNTVELKEQVITAETDRQKRYNIAVREGNKAEQEKILEEQQVAVAAFAKHDALGKTVLGGARTISVALEGVAGKLQNSENFKKLQKGIDKVIKFVKVKNAGNKKVKRT